MNFGQGRFKGRGHSSPAVPWDKEPQDSYEPSDHTVRRGERGRGRREGDRERERGGGGRWRRERKE